MMHRTGFLVLLCVALFTLFSTPAPAQYIYVANAGEDTISKLDLTGTEVARYRTAPAGAPHGAWEFAAPSRIAFDSSGNVYVLNRYFGPSSTSPFSPCPSNSACKLPVLLKILPAGGTCGTTTSCSSTPLPFGTDVRVAWAVPVGNPGTDNGALGRALCIDPGGNLWVGIYWTGVYYKLDSVTGNTLAGPIATPGHTPYGCAVDASGTLWSASETTNVAEIDTNTNTFKRLWDHSTPTNFGEDYSISVLGGCGASSKVYLSERALGRTYIALDPLTSQFSNAPSSLPQIKSVAIGVTHDGNIVSGNFIQGGVIKYSPSGTLLWSSSAQPTISTPGSCPNPSGSTQNLVRGLIIDANDDIWAVNLYDNSVSKYRGSDGLPLGVFPVGRCPYTYSNVPPPNCPCALIDKSSIQCPGNGAGSYSYSFTFTNNSPFSAPATGMELTSTGVTNLTPTSPVTFPPVPPNGTGTVAGTFTVANPQPGNQVCLTVKLEGGSDAAAWCCPSQQVCFVLPQCRDCAKAQAQFKCNDRGTWDLELTVTNGGPSPATSVQVFSTTPGVTVTPANTSLSLAPNASVTVQLGISGAAPGQTIDLTVSLHGPTDPQTGVFSWCCSSSVQVVYPKGHCRVIQGEVFNDANRNGTLDYSEVGISGWTVVLEGGSGAPRTATTDSTGAYRFEVVQPGAYRLTVRNPGGRWRPTTPESGSYAVTVDGPTIGPFNFGFVQP